MAAKQAGIIPIRGALGNLTFFKMKKGSYHVRQRSKVDPQKRQTSPRYKRVIEVNTEFSTANKGASLFRNASIEMAKRAGDTTMYRRLLKCMIRVLQSDPTNARGSRTIADGDTRLLNKFQFGGSPLSSSFLPQYKTRVNRTTGNLSVEVPGFNPERDVICSGCSTYFQLHAMGLAINFHNGRYSMNMKSSEHYSCKNSTIQNSVLDTSIPPNSNCHYFLLFGIEFFVETNGVLYELNNKKDNVMEVAEVSKAE